MPTSATSRLLFSLAIGAVLAIPGQLAAEDYQLGVILSLSGPGSLDCKEDLEGIQLAVDEINAAGGLLGQHPIKLTVKDDTGKPDISAQQAKVLIAEAKPRALIGVWSSGCALAVKPIITEAKVLMIAGHSNSEDITKLNPSPYVYSVVPNTYMLAKALAKTLAVTAKAKGWKTYATIASDYPFGRSLQGNVVANLKALMPELELKEQRWPKLGESEWPSHMAALAGGKPDFIFNGLSGDDLKRFTTAAVTVKFTDRFPCPGAAVPLNTLMDQKDGLPLGSLAMTRAVFHAHLDVPAMKHLIEIYKAKRDGRFPSDWVILHYDAVMALKQGVEKAKSIDTEAVKTALKGATIETTRGQLTFRAIDNQLACPVYLGTIGADPAYTFPIYKDLVVVPAGDTMRPEAEVEAARVAK
mgnify:CR=1 FL=1